MAPAQNAAPPAVAKHHVVTKPLASYAKSTEMSRAIP